MLTCSILEVGGMAAAILKDAQCENQHKLVDVSERPHLDYLSTLVE